MRRFLLNLSLAIVWMGLTGTVSEWNFLGGLAVGALIISVYSRVSGDTPYLGRGWNLVTAFVEFFVLLIKSNLKVCWEVLTPEMHQRPRIVRYPVEGFSDAHRTALASAIILTPGTLVIDTSPDNNYLYVHCMYAQDRDQAIADLDEVARVVSKGLFA